VGRVMGTKRRWTFKKYMYTSKFFLGDSVAVIANSAAAPLNTASLCLDAYICRLLKSDPSQA
jgi:hypothetical protein